MSRVSLFFIFERLDISLASIIHPSQKLWPFEFAESFRVQIQACRYMIGLNHTPESKVMAVWVCSELSCSISSVSIHNWLESDIWVKSYGCWNFPSLACLISSVSIYYPTESDIRVKCYDHLNFSRASIVKFWASLYIMGFNHTLESEVMVVRICREISCSNFSVSTYYRPESDIQMKSYDPLNFLRASIIQFNPSWYIMGHNHTPESKVMIVWICPQLSSLISSVSIYYWPQSDIRVKSYGLFNFPCASMFNFDCLDIYYATKSNIQVKSYDHLNFLRASVIQFRPCRYIIGLNHTPSQKLWPYEFALSFHV